MSFLFDTFPAKELSEKKTDSRDLSSFSFVISSNTSVVLTTNPKIEFLFVSFLVITEQTKPVGKRRTIIEINVLVTKKNKNVRRQN
jgi:hypothetical protein